jgi:predicted PurR-regulated permease PerM
VISPDQVNGPLPAGRDLTSTLRYEIQDLIGDVRKHLRKKGDRSNEATDQIEDAIEALAIDIDLFLDQDFLEENIMMRVAWVAALVLITLTILVLLWQFSAAVVMFLLSLAAAAAFRPMIETLSQRVPQKGLALAISFGLVVVALLALIFVVSGPLIANLQQAIDDLFMAYGRLKNIWLHAQSPLMVNLAEQLPPTQVLYDALIGDDPGHAIQAVFGAAEGTFEFLGRLAIVVALSLYWSADHVRFERLWLSLLPVESRAQARKIWQAIETGIGAYLRREFTLSVLGGVCLWIGYLMLGIHYPILLALIGALARLIPWLGPVLMALLLILAGSELGGWASLAAAAYTLLILILLEMTLGTRIFSRQRYSSLPLVIVMMALADSFGFLGVVLAPMLAVAIQILFSNLLPIHAVEPNGTRDQTYTGLQEKMELIKQMTTTLGGPHASETASLTMRLEQLLEKSLSVEQKNQEMYLDSDQAIFQEYTGMPRSGPPE